MGETQKKVIGLTGTAQGRATGHPATARIKTNFAVQHMLAAARFSRLSAGVESSQVTESSDIDFDELTSYVTATILTSAAGLEANINELFIDAHRFFSEYTEGNSQYLWELLWGKVECKPTLQKYELAFWLKKHARMSADQASPLYASLRSAKTLIDVRNALLHFKPQWDDEEKSHRALADRLLEANIETRDSGGSMTIFPTAFMTGQMARWAVLTNLDFIEAFSRETGLPNRYSGFLDRLNPGFPTWPQSGGTAT